MPIGVIVNSLAIAIGGFIGAKWGSRVSTEFKEKLNLIFGVCAMGIGIGSIAYVVIRILTGEYKKSDIVVTLISILFILRFVFILETQFAQPACDRNAHFIGVILRIGTGNGKPLRYGAFRIGCGKASVKA